MRLNLALVALSQIANAQQATGNIFRVSILNGSKQKIQKKIYRNGLFPDSRSNCAVKWTSSKTVYSTVRVRIKRMPYAVHAPIDPRETSAARVRTGTASRRMQCVRVMPIVRKWAIVVPIMTTHVVTC